MATLSKNEYEALFGAVKEDLQCLIGDGVNLNNKKKKLSADFFRIEKIWKEQKNQFFDDGDSIKCVMFGEYPTKIENYIYKDEVYKERLKQNGIVILDLIPFTIKYKKTTNRYFRVLKKCKIYWKRKFYCLKALIDEKTDLFFAYKRMCKLEQLEQAGFDELGFSIERFITFDEISPEQISLKTRIDEYLEKYANHE